MFKGGWGIFRGFQMVSRVFLMGFKGGLGGGGGGLGLEGEFEGRN